MRNTLYLTTIVLLAFLSTACEKKIKVPDGFEIISQDRKSFFVYVEREFWGDKISQRQTGRTICNELYKYKNYCEVWYFAERSEVPTKFPIFNRLNPIGKFEIKESKEKFRTLGSNR